VVELVDVGDRLESLLKVLYMSTCEHIKENGFHSRRPS
jgi:hypothetical protein